MWAVALPRSGINTPVMAQNSTAFGQTATVVAVHLGHRGKVLAVVVVTIIPQAVAVEHCAKVTVEEGPTPLPTAVEVAVLAKQVATQPTNRQLLGEGAMVVMA